MKRGRELKRLVAAAVAIPLVFVLTFLGVMVLIYTDKHYACLRSVMVKILGTENHFEGGLWFSAEATIVGAFISALPGLMCGILAYTQTNRLHDLEARYHRPGIELRKAQIVAADLKVDEGRLDDMRGWLPETECIYRYGIEKAVELKYPFYINFKAAFSVKNEIIIKEMYVKQVEIRLGDDHWKIDWLPEKRELEKFRHKTWDFDRKTEKGSVIYTLDCSLCPREGCWDEDKSDAFWKVIRDFIYYRSVENQSHRYLILNVHICVVYEYGDPKGEEGVLHLEVDGNQKHKEEYLIRDSSCNGYFTFDMK